MKLVLVLLLLLVVSVPMAAEDPLNTPKKGDFVFLSVKLESLRLVAPLTAEFGVHAVEKCQPLKIKAIKPKKEKMRLTESSGVSHVLRGNWGSVIHKNRDSCLKNQQENYFAEWSSSAYYVLHNSDTPSSTVRSGGPE